MRCIMQCLGQCIEQYKGSNLEGGMKHVAVNREFSLLQSILNKENNADSGIRLSQRPILSEWGSEDDSVPNQPERLFWH